MVIPSRRIYGPPLNGFDFHFPALRRRHTGAVCGLTHQPAGRRTVGHEDHARGHLTFLAGEQRFAVARADAHRAAGGDARFLHIIGVHRDGVDDGLVFRTVLADVDLLALLGGAARIHEEPLARHAHTPPSAMEHRYSPAAFSLPSLAR